LNLRSDLKNLYFTVLGGLIVAAFSYLFFSPASEYQNRLTAEYRRIQITYADSIFNDLALSRLFKAKDAICEGVETSDCSKKLAKIADLLPTSAQFQNRHYTAAHELIIRNDTEFSVANLEIEHDFSYVGYVIFNKDNKYFHRLSKGSVFSIEELKPGKKVEAVFFSGAGYSADASNINVTESGKSLKLRPIYEGLDGPGLFSEELSSIVWFSFRNPFMTYLISISMFLSLLIILISLVMLVIRKVFPDFFRSVYARQLGKTEYNWLKSVLNLYEENRREDGKK